MRIFLVLAVLVPIGLFASAAYQDWLHLVAETKARMTHQRDALAEHAARVVKTQELVAFALSDRVAGRSWSDIQDSRELFQFIYRLEQHFPEVLAVWMADAEGTVRIGSEAFPAPSINVSHRRYFQAVRDGAASVTSERYRPRFANGEGFTYAIRRERPDGTFDGSIGVAVRIDYLQEFYRDVVPPGSSVVLMHQNGSLLARFPADRALPERLPADAPFMRHLRSADEGTGELQSVLDGRWRHYAFRRVAGTPVVISYSVTQDELLQRWRERVGLYGAYVLPGLMLLTGLAVLTWRNIQTLDHTVQQRTSALAAALDEKGRALADRETLLQEVHHRVKNNLQIVSSLVRMQARTASDPEDTVRRILSMALVHELIYAMPGSFTQIDLADYTRRLVDALSHTSTGPREIHLTADPVSLDLDKALPFGLVLSEAVTNALKHGGPQARVSVSLTADGDDSVVLRVSNDGSPPRQDLPTSEGFGLRLIERIAVQLDGQIQFRQEADALFEMRFPAAVPSA